MARRRVSPGSDRAVHPVPQAVPVAAETVPSPITKPEFWTGPKVILAVVLLFGLQAWLAVTSLLQENPTVDEIAHMPAGITYWQKGTFKLYHHNPPLVKLVAAVPVVWTAPESTKGLYEPEPGRGRNAWQDESQAGFGIAFARQNYANYFELFQLARMMMPGFLLIGGLVVFAWSSRLYGQGGGCSV